MIAGVEGRHTANGVTLNDPSSWPWYKLRRVELHHLADFEPEADKLIGRPGEIPRYADRSGKAIVYEGDVMARSMADLSAARAELVGAFSGTDEIRFDSVCVAEDEDENPIIPPRFYFARPLELSPPDEQTVSASRRSLGFERPFTLTLRMSDPRFYDPEEVEVEDATISAVGGNPIPFTPGNRVEPASADGFQLTVANTGNADTDGQLELHGPWRNPVVKNTTLADDPFLRFRDLVIDSGEEVVIDFRRRTAERTNGTSVRHKLDPASTWWDRGVPCFAPGNNVIRGRGYDLASPAKLIARCNPADYA